MHFSALHTAARPAQTARIFTLFTLFAILLATACGGEDASPTQVNTPEPMVVPDGTFAVTATEIFKTCDQPNRYNGDFEITFDGDSFTMGSDWEGTWDAMDALARGESVREEEQYRECKVSTWTAVEMTFTSPDECSGTIKYRRSVSGSCNTNCTVTWGFDAVRK
jgi:hypothetical protein